MPGSLTAGRMAGATNVSKATADAGSNGASEFVHHDTGKGNTRTRTTSGPASPTWNAITKSTPGGVRVQI
jgi:hypothetical protein